MRKVFFTIVVVVIVTLVVGITADTLNLSCQVQVPKKFQQDPAGWIPPNGEPESVRYTKSYEAFWWNCVVVKAGDLGGRCPSTCSGTPAAAYGCSDGAMDAANQIALLLREHSVAEVKKYLQVLAEDPQGLSKTKPYFPNGPRAEKVPQ